MWNFGVIVGKGNIYNNFVLFLYNCFYMILSIYCFGYYMRFERVFVVFGDFESKYYYYIVFG